MAIVACSDPTPIGASLLDQDQEDVFFTDTLSIAAEHFFQDSVVTYTPSSPISNLPFGTYVDPIFGTNKSEFFFQLTPGSISLPVLNSFEVDSVNLVFEIDSLDTYGEITNDLDFELFEITDAFDPDTTYFSDGSFAPGLIPITSGSFFPDIHTDKILPLTENDTLTGKMINIPLPNLMGKQLLDTMLLSNFDEEFFGLYFKNNSANSNEGMISINPESQIGLTSLNVFYTDINDGDTTNYTYRFLISPVDVRILNLENDISGTPIETAIADGDEELWYIQGLEGPEIKLSFPNLADLGNILINSAFLELTAANLPEDDLTKFTPANQLIVTYIEDGRFFTIDDVGQGASVFGGGFVDDEDITAGIAGTYRLNLSNYFQKIVDGTAPSEIFIEVSPKAYNPARSIIYGLDSVNKPKLELTYTRINP